MKRALKILAAVLLLAVYGLGVGWFVHEQAMSIGRMQGRLQALNMVVVVCKQGKALFTDERGTTYVCRAALIL